MGMLRAAKDSPTTIWHSAADRWSRSRSFLIQVRNELERVTWPSKKEVYAATLVVILNSMLFGIYLWSVDLVLNTAVGFVFRAFGVA